MNEPRINVDHFYHRPVYHVVGLLTENSEFRAISKDLESAGADLRAMEILCGEQGARILDEHGRYHGLRGRCSWQRALAFVADHVLRSGTGSSECDSAGHRSRSRIHF